MALISQEVYYQVRSGRFNCDIDGGIYYDEASAKARVSRMDPTYKAYYIKVTITRESI